MNPLTKILGNDIFPVDFQLTKIFNIPSTIQTLQLFLLGMGDEESLVLYEFYFPLSIRRGIAREAFRREKKKQSFSTYDHYGKSSSIFSASINQNFEVINANEPLSSLIHVKKGFAIFMTASIVKAQDQRPLEFKKGYVSRGLLQVLYYSLFLFPRDKEAEIIRQISMEISTVGEQIDRNITLDLQFRGVIEPLYPPAREKTREPFVIKAAKKLKRVLKTEDVVFIANEWPDRPHINPEIAETDGPPGVTVLGRALHCVFSAIPFFWIGIWGVGIWFILHKEVTIYGASRCYKIKPTPRKEIPVFGRSVREGRSVLLLPFIVFLPFLIDAWFPAVNIARVSATGKSAFTTLILFFVLSAAILYTLIISRKGLKISVSPVALIKLYQDALKQIWPITVVVLFSIAIGFISGKTGIGAVTKDYIVTFDFSKVQMVSVVTATFVFLKWSCQERPWWQLSMRQP